MFNPPLPMIETGAPPWRSDLPRWQHLVSGHWLAQLLAGRPVVAAPAGDWRLFEVHDGPWQPQHAGHVPGAHWLDTHVLERAPLWNVVADAMLLQTLPALGIRHDTTVILTGQHQSAAATSTWASRPVTPPLPRGETSPAPAGAVPATAAT